MTHTCARRRAAAFAAVVLFAVTSSAARAEETYAVRLTRPAAVGQEYTLTAKADFHRTATYTANGRSRNKDETFSAELSADAKVEAVNEKVGTATRLTLTIGKLTKDGAEILPAGTAVTVDHDGDELTFGVGGAAVDAEKTAVLRALVEIDRPDRTVTDDQAFGTPQPQAVGGTWDGDPAKVAGLMAESHIPVSAEHAKASGKLVEVKAGDAVPTEVVELTIKIDAMDKGGTIGPMTVTDGSVDATQTVTLPTDGTSPPIAFDEHTTFTLNGTVRAKGNVVAVQSKTEHTVHRTMTPKK